MPTSPLTPEAKWENATALAAALGIEAREAAELLDLSVLVTADSADAVAHDIAREVAMLLGRTVRHAATTEVPESVRVELVVGSARPRTGGLRVYLQVNDGSAVVSSEDQGMNPCRPAPEILRVLIACYAAAAALNSCVHGLLAFGMPKTVVLELEQFGVDSASLARPIHLGRAYLAGAGAIGNGFLWAARRLNIYGRLEVVDDDFVGPGNLNRQVWFGPNDINKPKADQLVLHAQPYFPRLELVPRRARLQELPEKTEGPWLEKLIVAVDSRRARRALQNEFPGLVYDASTTDIREIVVHYNEQPTDAACLSCIYEPDEAELTREQHIADHLGVPIKAVRSERISADCARMIANRFPTLDAAALEGTAYDSLFKRLCSEGQLRTVAGKRVVAPFAFVSVMAGALLALEIVRRSAPAEAPSDNYWRISPWHPPLARRRVRRPRQLGCDFCGSPLLQRVNKHLWAR